MNCSQGGRFKLALHNQITQQTLALFFICIQQKIHVKLGRSLIYRLFCFRRTTEVNLTQTGLNKIGALAIASQVRRRIQPDLCLVADYPLFNRLGRVASVNRHRL